MKQRDKKNRNYDTEKIKEKCLLGILVIWHEISNTYTIILFIYMIYVEDIRKMGKWPLN